MSTVRLSGSSSGYYDLTVPAVAGTNSIDLSNLPVKDSNGNLGIGTNSPANFGGQTIQVNHASSYSSVLATSGSYSMQFMASQNNGVMNMGARSNHPVSITTNDTPRLTIDASGRVTTPSQPSFLVRRNSSTFTTSANQYFPFDSNSIYGGYDVGGNYNTSTYLYTVPITGTYFFHAYTICSTTLSNGQWSIRKNGGAIHDHHISQPSTSWYHHTLTITTQCAANDTIGIYVAGAYAFYGLSWSGFMGHLLG